MNVTEQSLRDIEQHWAVQAIADDGIEQADMFADQLLVKKAVGKQMQFDFAVKQPDDELLNKVAMAYQIAAIEAMSGFLNPVSSDEGMRGQFATGAYKAFGIKRLLEVPSDDAHRMFHVLHLSALAYCGERWTDLRRWYKENEEHLAAPSVEGEMWDERLLNRLFECWMRLFRKGRWENMERIHSIIASLREDQQQHEDGVLSNPSNIENRAVALRLISLYHWAKATEIQATYVLQGSVQESESANVVTLLDKHFQSAIKSAEVIADTQLEFLLRWLHAAGRQMVQNSIWWVAKNINSRVTKFVGHVTRQQGLFEMLPPQQAAIQRHGLLDQAATAIVVDIPTSGGKTLLAQFRILQALNQFAADEDGKKGWVAYVTPTKALSAQITRRLRRDFSPIGINVEQLTGAIDIDAFEEDILAQEGKENAFDVLVATPEKLQLVIRNGKVKRPLALVVMDEAHNIEDDSRGLRIELLLATIKRERREAKFLLLMPFVKNADAVAQWLAHDAETGRSISLSTAPWQPNERIVGIFEAVADESQRAGWRLQYETLVTTPKTIHLHGKHHVGEVKPLDFPKSEVISREVQKGTSIQTAAMAKIMSTHGTSIAVANNVDHVWGMARKISDSMAYLESISDNIQLVQKFLAEEISADFELIDMLSRGIGVHHSGLSDEARALIEWLAEEGDLRVLCATTTIAQGINFPVSSVFLATNKYPYGVEMTPREFWNLAGRAGRINHDSIGVVGLAAGNEPNQIKKYVLRAMGDLISQLVALVEKFEESKKELGTRFRTEFEDLDFIIFSEQWEDFRCYVAHLWREKKQLDAVLLDTEQLLRNTFGYGGLENGQSQNNNAEKLLELTKEYAKRLSENPGHATLADMTGFTPEGISTALVGMNTLEKRLKADDWKPNSLFGENRDMANLYGVMLRVPQLRKDLKEISGEGLSHSQLANITKAWVSGDSIEKIAREYFTEEKMTTAEITKACQAIYKKLVNNGTWGMSALSRLSLDFDGLTDAEKRQVNMIPAMIYHGVKSEEGILLRMNSVPRSIAEPLGEVMKTSSAKPAYTIQDVRDFLKQPDLSAWNSATPQGSSLSGEEYKRIWQILSGEGR